MPRALHEELAHTAERETVSLNQLIVRILSRSVARPLSEAEGSTLGEPDAVAPVLAVALPHRQPRTLTVALVVNLVVIVLVGALAIALLIAAWRGGF
jgi:hypothetical protein